MSIHPVTARNHAMQATDQKMTVVPTAIFERSTNGEKKQTYFGDDAVAKSKKGLLYSRSPEETIEDGSN